MKYTLFAVLLLVFSLGVFYRMINREEPKKEVTNQENTPTGVNKVETTEAEVIEVEITEEFIYRLLQNENGTIATYIKDNGETDEDLVKGREALAETLGLLMYYALDKDDQELFDNIYKQLTDDFLESDGFVNWKLNEDGTSEVSANALIDDIRILYALVLADDKWMNEQYMTTATSIGEYLNEHNVLNGVYTNFYDQEFDYASSDISLSYIDIQGMEVLVERELLDSAVVEETSKVLLETPLKNGFYPKTFNVKNNEYIFSESINIVDQAILAYHYAQVGNRSEEFLAFIKNEMETRGLVHGMYDLQTKEPIVDYESPAIYGFLILYALEVEEYDLAQALYSRVKEFQIVDENSEYYGGYSITDGNTHIFDNLIPLLAELELKIKLEES